MKFLLQMPLHLPLHYQILVALVLGTIIGVFVNPGEIALPDQQVDVQSLREPGQFRVTVKTDADSEELTLSEGAFRTQFNAIYQRFKKEEFPEEQTYKITKRRAHLAEDGKWVSLAYTRLIDSNKAISTLKAQSVTEFKEQFPRWATIYDKHGGGASAMITMLAKYVGDMFLRLLKMVTIPLIVFSLISGITGLGSSSRLGSMFGKTLLYYLTTSILAITIGIGMANLVRPGVGANLPGSDEAVEQAEERSLIGVFSGLLESMIPDNPIESLAGAQFLSIITFSILLGLFIINTGGESEQTLTKFFQAGFDVMMNMTLFIIRLAPIGVFAFMLFATASQGLDIFLTLAWYMLAVFLSLLTHAVIVLPLIVLLVARRSPWKYFQAMSPALMTAFSTASSNGTLPLTISCVEKRAGVSNRISSFVLPLGATINMDGTALYEVVAVLFIAQATPGFAIGLDAQIVVAITALLASVGAAGIPHAGLVMMAIVLQAVGLPLEAQGVIIAVDRVLDMCRTAVNVWSDSCGCAVLERLEPDQEEPTLRHV